MYRFSSYVSQQVQTYRAEGKNPYDLFDPSKPDYLGKPEIVNSYKIPLTQQIENITQGLTSSAPSAGSVNALPSVVQKASKTATNAQGAVIYLVDGQWLNADGSAVAAATTEPKASDYKTKEDVTAAYRADKITREQATKILIENGWAAPATAPAVPTGQ